MKPILRYLAVLGAVLLAALAGIGLWISTALTGGAKERILAALRESTGLAVTATTVQLDFGSLVRLQPAIALDGFAIANPPGFASPDLLRARKVSADADLTGILSKRLRVRALTVLEPEIRIERNTQGKTNLQVLLEALPGRAVTPAAKPGEPPSHSPGVAVRVDRFTIVRGEITVAGDAPGEIHDLDLTISGMEAGKPCRVLAAAKLTGARRSPVSIDAAVGPVQPRSLPVKGSLRMQLRLADLPAAQRQQHFGTLIGEPGPDSRLDLTAQTAGDLLRAIQASGTVSLSDFYLGKDARNRLPFSGEAPLQLAATGTLSTPEFSLRTAKSKLRLGTGEFEGAIEFSRRGKVVSGLVAGGIRNVDINAMLGALTESQNKLSGTASFPEFRLRFSGASAASLRASLAGSGSFEVENALFPGLNLLAGIERAIAVLGGQFQAGPAAETGHLRTRIELGDERIQVENLTFETKTAQITGRGTVTFARDLDFTLNAKMAGNLALSVLSALRRGPGELNIPVRITGTADRPVVAPDVAPLRQGAVKGVLDLLRNRLQRK